jgi:hypothetical protein
MKILKKMIGVGMALFVAGCITSIHPFYTEKDLTFDSSLIGTWIMVDPETGKKEEDISWTFKKGEENTYELIVEEKNYVFREICNLDSIIGDIISKSISIATGKQGQDDLKLESKDEKSEPGEPAKFKAHLVKMKGSLFLDISTKDWGVKNTFYVMHMIPVHTFWRISIKKDELRMEMLNPEWLKNMVDQKKINMGYVQKDDTIILTAPTEELQKFLLKYDKEAEVFTPFVVFHRQK